MCWWLRRQWRRRAPPPRVPAPAPPGAAGAARRPRPGPAAPTLPAGWGPRWGAEAAQVSAWCGRSNNTLSAGAPRRCWDRQERPGAGSPRVESNALELRTAAGRAVPLGLAAAGASSGRRPGVVPGQTCRLSQSFFGRARSASRGDDQNLRAGASCDCQKESGSWGHAPAAAAPQCRRAHGQPRRWRSCWASCTPRPSQQSSVSRHAPRQPSRACLPKPHRRRRLLRWKLSPDEQAPSPSPAPCSRGLLCRLVFCWAVHAVCCHWGGRIHARRQPPSAPSVSRHSALPPLLLLQGALAAGERPAGTAAAAPPRSLGCPAALMLCCFLPAIQHAAGQRCCRRRRCMQRALCAPHLLKPPARRDLVYWGDPGVRLPEGGVLKLCGTADPAVFPPGSANFRWTSPQGVCRILGDAPDQCPGGCASRWSGRSKPRFLQSAAQAGALACLCPPASLLTTPPLLRVPPHPCLPQPSSARPPARR